MKKTSILRSFSQAIIAGLFFLYTTSTAFCEVDTANPWPKEIKTQAATIVIYQPQPETLQNNRLDGRFAISVELKEKKEPVFGAIWFSAQLETDREERNATIERININRIRFPNQDSAKTGKLKKILEREIPRWDFHISMERLIASLDIEAQKIKASENIRTAPPAIVFMPEPAVLITIDGDPLLTKIDNSDVMRIINTPYTLLFDPRGKKYYLNANATTWYTASAIEGSWSIASSVPYKITTLAAKNDKSNGKQASNSSKSATPPKIVIATKPTELISTAGKPEYSPISGTNLLYIHNTESSVLMDIHSQYHYVLLSGRWYKAKNMTDKWEYVAGNKLPKDFSKIPEEHKMGRVLYAVPGTRIAEESVLDAQIPQTAAIDRKKAKLKIEYDGTPKFENIPGTRMRYAVNSQIPVIRVGSRYYAVDNGVWFVSNSTTSVWEVATEIPDAIYTIPPSSPVYNVTFVHIYKSTPEVVYVGYTPGYTGTYVYHQTIVYGTGYYYPYWYGRYYYPRPATFGFHVHYNPWTGWGFGLSYSTGPFTFMIGGGGWYGGGWWGPARYNAYRAGYRHGWANGARAGYWAGQNKGRPELYRNSKNRDRVRPSTRDIKKPVGRDRAKPATRDIRKSAERNRAKPATRDRANNVFADRNGNIHRKTDKGWEKRTSNGWQRQKPSNMNRPSSINRPATRPSNSRYSGSSRQQFNRNGNNRQQQLNRSYNSRQRGAQRTRSFQRSRSAGRFSGARGGGRMRR
ncbi:MAG: carbohydrate-binding family V/XII [Mariprofundus sp.]